MFKATCSVKGLPRSYRPTMSEATVKHIWYSFQRSLRSSCEASREIQKQRTSLSTPMTQRRYTITNTHVSSGIQTQVGGTAVSVTTHYTG
ncbi:hypothetical protein TNCV_122181 [Trichonephila clavipes]|nr:hypothetical protein TNCV_122181 [Trichonephila clavipes]